MSNTGKKELINIERLNRFMDENGLDAVVARSGQNFTYLAGFVYPGTLARLLDLTDSDRAVFVLWPRTGEPVIITNSIAAGLPKRDSWIDRIEIYEGYVENPYSLLCELLTEYGLDKGRVGFEKNYISALHWEHVQKLLPNMNMVDCVAMMDQVRWIKTQGEIDLLKKGADLLDEALLDMFRKIKVGDTERMAHSMVISGCLDKGAGWVHGILNSSSNTIPYAGESGVVFQKGDVIRTDYVAYWDGYAGHQSRNLVFGKMTPEQDAEYQQNREIYLNTIDRCRDGARVGDIFDFVMTEFKKCGWTYPSLLVGHSVGPWWHQQEPILARDSDLVLEEGMVLALEPHKAHWHLQDMIVVKKGAPELISDKIPTDHPFISE